MAQVRASGLLGAATLDSLVLKSLEFKSEHVVAATTGRKCLSSKIVADEVLGRSLRVGPSRIRRTVDDASTVGSLTRRARSDGAGWIGCTSTAQNLSTGEQDEHLLHLRDIAQLKWRDIIRYFRGITLDAVKDWYSHVDESRMACPVAGDEPKSRVHVGGRMTHRAASTSHKLTKKGRCANSQPPSL